MQVLAQSYHFIENPGPQEVRLFGVFYPSGNPAVNYKD
jgi:hypothetical protein